MGLFMRRIATVVSLLCIGSVAAQEVTPKARPLSDGDVGELVELLGSRDYRDRERAGKALSAEGDRILAQLKAARATIEAPEVQRRLDGLIAAANAQRAFRPTLITVDCNGAPVKAVLRDICKQAGYKLLEGAIEDKKITLKLAAVPFWEAMAAVSDLSGFTIQPQDDLERTIFATGNDAHSPHTSFAGPFKFTASSIGSNRAIPLSNLPRRGRLANPEFIGLGVQIFAEPKLPIVGIGEVTLMKATDDKGTSLIPPVTEENRRAVRMYAAANYRSLNQSCSFDLIRGSREATALRELEAKVSVAVLVEERPEITVEKLLDAKGQKFVGTSAELEIDAVSEAKGGVTLTVTIRRGDANPDEYNGWTTAIQRLLAFDDAGAKMTPTGILDQSHGSATTTVRLGFAPAAGKQGSKPAKLVLNEWITETRAIAFKFKDIPLP
jgi:hypothetical protein